MDKPTANPENRKSAATVEVAIIALAVLFSMLAPVLIWPFKLPFILNSSSLEGDRFMLYTFFLTLVVVIAGGSRLWKDRDLGLAHNLPVILLGLITLHFLVLVREYSAKSPDYLCYEKAYIALIQGKPIYGEGYLYPPLTAQVFSKVFLYFYKSSIFLPAEGAKNPAMVTMLVHYLFQCMQVPMASLAFLLSYLFARRIGLKKAAAALIVFALFILSDPLIRNFKYNQINLPVLNLVLGSLLVLNRMPWVAGLLIALGGHIKLYPLILVLPWFAAGQRKAVISAILGFGLVFLFQTEFLKQPDLWIQFVKFSRDFPVSLEFYNNSLQAAFANTGKLISWSLPGGFTRASPLFSAITVFGFFGWMVVRFRQRESAARESVLVKDGEEAALSFRVFGHSMDAIALSLLISPVTWHHHYLLAVPIVIWAVAVRGAEKPWSIGVAAFLMFGVPMFGVYLFSWHLIVGLIMILVLTGPRRSASCWAGGRHRLWLEQDRREGLAEKADA